MSNEQLPDVKSASYRGRDKVVIPIHDDPRVQEAIRLYTDPLMPTFGVKSAAARAAGVASTVFQRKEVQKEIERIGELRSEAGEKVAEYMSQYTWDAAREVVQQLGLGRELKLEDPTELLSDEGIAKIVVEQVGELDPDNPEGFRRAVNRVTSGLANRAAELNRHNKNVIASAKERRAAAELLIRYHLGGPEQRMHITRKDDSSGPQELSEMSDEDLRKFGRVIEDELGGRQPGNVIPEAEVVEGPAEE